MAQFYKNFNVHYMKRYKSTSWAIKNYSWVYIKDSFLTFVKLFTQSVPCCLLSHHFFPPHSPLWNQNLCWGPWKHILDVTWVMGEDHLGSDRDEMRRNGRENIGYRWIEPWGSVPHANGTEMKSFTSGGNTPISAHLNTSSSASTHTTEGAIASLWPRFCESISQTSFGRHILHS